MDANVKVTSNTLVDVTSVCITYTPKTCSTCSHSIIRDYGPSECWLAFPPWMNITRNAEDRIVRKEDTCSFHKYAKVL